MSRKSKHMRLPNSYGSIVKMSNANRRRRPYVVRITTGYHKDPDTGKTKQHLGIIGYAKTREEGLQMLAKYHEAPYDLNQGNPSFREVYQDWFDDKFKDNMEAKKISGYRAAYNTCTRIFEFPFRDIRPKDLQNVIDNCGKNYPTLKNIKILFNQMYKYAIKNGLCSADYSKYVDIAKYHNKNPNSLDRQAFTKDQLNALWSERKDAYVQMVLILCYTGVRISELLDLKKEDVNLEEHYFNVIKSKTESGIRKVPIGTMIYPYFKAWYESSECEYVFHTPNQMHFEYRNYYDSYFIPIMDRYSYPQTPHCCRHTCISLLATAHVSPTYQKMIVGHKGAMSITESVYTHIEMSELIKAIDSVYYPDEVMKEYKKSDKKKHEYER